MKVTVNIRLSFAGRDETDNWTCSLHVCGRITTNMQLEKGMVILTDDTINCPDTLRKWTIGDVSTRVKQSERGVYLEPEIMIFQDPITTRQEFAHCAHFINFLFDVEHPENVKFRWLGVNVDPDVNRYEYVEKDSRWLPQKLRALATA